LHAPTRLVCQTRVVAHFDTGWTRTCEHGTVSQHKGASIFSQTRAVANRQRHASRTSIEGIATPISDTSIMAETSLIALTRIRSDRQQIRSRNCIPKLTQIGVNVTGFRIRTRVVSHFDFSFPTGLIGRTGTNSNALNDASFTSIVAQTRIASQSEGSRTLGHANTSIVSRTSAASHGKQGIRHFIARICCQTITAGWC